MKVKSTTQQIQFLIEYTRAEDFKFLTGSGSTTDLASLIDLGSVSEAEACKESRHFRPFFVVGLAFLEGVDDTPSEMSPAQP